MVYLPDVADERIVLQSAAGDARAARDSPDVPQERFFVRRTVALMLDEVQLRLPNDLRLIIREGYRTGARARELFEQHLALVADARPELTPAEHYSIARALVNLPSDGSPPGHMTGGAVDVGLADADGNPLPMRDQQSDIPMHDQFFTDCPGLPESIAVRREQLTTVMESVGFINNAREYWHFSYGDPYWAVKTPHKQAKYGVIDLPKS